MTKFTNTFIPNYFDLVVTRHRPLVEWLQRAGYIDASTPVVEHAHADAERSVVEATDRGWLVCAGRRVLRRFEIPEGEALCAQVEDELMSAAISFSADNNAANVRNKHVIGVLPHHLSARAASVTEVQLDWTLHDRRRMQGGNLDVEDVHRAARGLHTYTVRRVEAGHMHSAAVEAAWRYVERYGANFGAGPGIVKWAKCEPVRGLEVTMIGSGCEQAHAHIILSRGVWRGQSKGPWLDGLGREVPEEQIDPAAGWDG